MKTISKLDVTQRTFLIDYVKTRIANLKKTSSDGVVAVFEELLSMLDRPGARKPEGDGETIMYEIGSADLPKSPPTRRRKKSKADA